MKTNILLLLCTLSTLQAALAIAYQETSSASFNITSALPELTPCVFPGCIPLSGQELFNQEQTDQGNLETVTISKEYLTRSLNHLILDEVVEVSHLASTNDQYVVIIKADAEIRDVEILMDEKPDLTSESKKHCRIKNADPDHFYSLRCPVSRSEENSQVTVVTYKGVMWNAVTVRSAEAATPVIVTLKPEAPHYTIINSRQELTYPERISLLSGLKASSGRSVDYSWLTSTWTDESITRVASGSRVLQVNMLQCLNCFRSSRPSRKISASSITVRTYPDLRRGDSIRDSVKSSHSQISTSSTINPLKTTPPGTPHPTRKDNMRPDASHYKISTL